jgi:hypothetical protein
LPGSIGENPCVVLAEFSDPENINLAYVVLPKPWIPIVISRVLGFTSIQCTDMEYHLQASALFLNWWLEPRNMSLPGLELLRARRGHAV